MVDSFSRTLSLLRSERKLSQREAAASLDVSQALLSHYENGLREPGLSFVVRAADFYQVSADYLLGRTMERDGAAVDFDAMPDAAEDKDNRLRGSIMAVLQKKLIVNSVGLIFDILGKAGCRTLITEAAAYLSTAVYKTFRYIYKTGGNPPSFFSVSQADFPALSDANMKLHEMMLARAADDLDEFPDNGELNPSILAVSHEMLRIEYPAHSQALLTLLHNVGESMGKLTKAGK